MIHLNYNTIKQVFINEDYVLRLHSYDIHNCQQENSNREFGRFLLKMHKISGKDSSYIESIVSSIQRNPKIGYRKRVCNSLGTGRSDSLVKGDNAVEMRVNQYDMRYSMIGAVLDRSLILQF